MLRVPHRRELPGPSVPTGTLGPTPAAAASGRERRSNRMPDLMEVITALAKRRGVVFPSSEIYGGLRSFWGYGPLGFAPKPYVKGAWCCALARLRGAVLGLGCPVIMAARAVAAGSHLP